MLRLASTALLGLLLLAGCGDDESSAAAPPTGPSGPCLPGEVTVDDGCEPAGLPSTLACAPGEAVTGDGCVPPGVPPGGCAAGFVHDGDGGCLPTLPSQPCGPGEMALPGETSCREVAPCAAGTWGDIPIDSSTQHVDISYPNNDSDGSAGKPWTTIQQAVDAAAPGAIVAIAAGRYLEDVRATGRPVRLWGRCPSMVEIAGTGARLGAVLLLQATDGSEVRSLAVTGAQMGVTASGSNDHVIEHVWVHDTGWRGVDVEDDLGPSSARLSASLVEGAGDFGVLGIGSRLTVEDSVVRDTATKGAGDLGGGIRVQRSPNGVAGELVLQRSLVERNRHVSVFALGGVADIDACVVRDSEESDSFARGVGAETDGDSGSTLTLARSLISGNGELGVGIIGSQARIDATVIRDNDDRSGGPGAGRGISVQASDTVPSALELSSTLIAGNVDVGLFLAGAQATVESVAIRDTVPNMSGIGGRGIGAQSQLTTFAPSLLTLSHSTLERNHEVALAIIGSQATLEAVAVRDTLDSGGHGHGIAARSDVSGQAARLDVHASLIERSYEIGVFVVGTDAIVSRSEVRDTVAGGPYQQGRGMQVQLEGAEGLLSQLLVSGSRVSGSIGFGLFVSSATASIEDSVIADTVAGMGAQPFGDALGASSSNAPATATVDHSRFSNSERAAVVSFGASVSLGDSELVCQTLDLNAEPNVGTPASFEDRGGTFCGCPEADGECKAQGLGVSAPDPLPPPEE